MAAFSANGSRKVTSCRVLAMDGEEVRIVDLGPGEIVDGPGLKQRFIQNGAEVASWSSPFRPTFAEL